MQLRAALGLAVIAALLTVTIAAAGPADLDTSFGSSGFATPASGVIALADDGSAVVTVGRSGVERLLAGGTADPAFNGGAPQTVGFTPTAVAVQSDHRVVVAGASAGNLEVARLNADGSVDTTFGTSGVTETPVGDSIEVNGAVIDPAGRIVVAGTATSTSIRRAFAARFIAAGDPGTIGELDEAGFNASGSTPGVAFLGVATSARAVDVTSTSKVVLAGGENQFLVARRLADGTPDGSFGPAGERTLSFGAATPANANAVRVAGTRTVAGGGAGDQAVVVALTDSGAFDASFGSGGQRLWRFGAADSSAAVQQLRLTGAGEVRTAGAVGDQLALARLTGAGALDARFGSRSDPPGTKLVAIGASGPITVTGLALSGADAVSAGFSFGGRVPTQRVARVGTPNRAPVISATGAPSTAKANESKGFQVTASDPDPDDTVAFTWDFGDGATATGASVAHAWSAGGTYTVKLTAADPYGLADTRQFTVTVSAPPDPVRVTIKAPNANRIVSGADFPFSAEATGGAGGYKFLWDFGEGRTWTEADLANPGDVFPFKADREGQAVTYRYLPKFAPSPGFYAPLAAPTPAPGESFGQIANLPAPPAGQVELRQTPLVRVRVTDADSNSAVAGVPIVVGADQPPTPSAVIACADVRCVNGQLEYDGPTAFASTSTDPDNSLYEGDKGGRDRIVEEIWDFHDNGPVIKRAPPCEGGSRTCLAATAITRNFFDGQRKTKRFDQADPFVGDTSTVAAALKQYASDMQASGTDFSGQEETVTLTVRDQSGKTHSQDFTVTTRKRRDPKPVLRFDGALDGKLTKPIVVNGPPTTVDLSRSVVDSHGSIAYTVLEIGPPSPKPCDRTKQSCHYQANSDTLAQVDRTYVVDGSLKQRQIQFPKATQGNETVSVLATTYDETGATGTVRYDGFRVFGGGGKCEDVDRAITVGGHDYSIIASCADTKGQSFSTTRPIELNGVKLKPADGLTTVVADCSGEKAVIAAVKGPPEGGTCTPKADGALQLIAGDDAIAEIPAGKQDSLLTSYGDEQAYGAVEKAAYKGFPLNGGAKLTLDGNGHSLATFYADMPPQFAAPGGTTTAPGRVEAVKLPRAVVVKPFDGYVASAKRFQRARARAAADAPDPTIAPKKESMFGPFRLPGDAFVYSKATNTFEANIDASTVPGLSLGPLAKSFKLRIVLANGKLREASGSLKDIPPINVAGAINLTGFAFDLRPDGDNMRLAGTVFFTDSASLGELIQGQATVAATLGTPLSFGITSDAKLAKTLPVHAEVGYAGGSVNVNASASYNFGPASFAARLAGAFGNGGFQVAGNGSACLFACLGIKGLLSERGLAGCGSIDLFIGSLEAGFGFLFATADLDILAGSCSFTKYQSAAVVTKRVAGPQPAYTVPGRAESTALSIVVAASDVKETASGGRLLFGRVPQVDLYAPDATGVHPGALIARSTDTLGAYSTSGNLAGMEKDAYHVLVDQDPVAGVVRFIVPKPSQTGTYFVQPRNDTVAIDTPRWAYSDPPVAKSLFDVKVTPDNSTDQAVESGKVLLAGTQKGAEDLAKVVTNTNLQAPDAKATAFLNPAVAKATPVPDLDQDQGTNATLGEIYQPAPAAPAGGKLLAENYVDPKLLTPYDVSSRLKLTFAAKLPPGNTVSFYEVGPLSRHYLGGGWAGPGGIATKELRFTPGGPDDGYSGQPQETHCITAIVADGFGQVRGTVDDLTCFQFTPPPRLITPGDTGLTLQPGKGIAILQGDIFQNGATPMAQIQLKMGHQLISRTISGYNVSGARAVGKRSASIARRSAAKTARTIARTGHYKLSFKVPRGVKKVKLTVGGVRGVPGARKPRAGTLTVTPKRRAATLRFRKGRAVVKHKRPHRKHRRKKGHKRKRG